jgi:UDP-glucose 4-epimerase
MKILVTGGAGFVGTNLSKRLVSLGHQVVSIDNYNTGLKSNHQEGVIYVEDDIINLKKKNKHFWSSFDMVFHMAAIARIQPSFEKPIDYFETNASATYI